MLEASKLSVEPVGITTGFSFPIEPTLKSFMVRSCFFICFCVYKADLENTSRDSAIAI